MVFPGFCSRYRHFTTASLKKPGVYDTKVIKEEITLRNEYLNYMRTVIPSMEDGSDGGGKNGNSQHRDQMSEMLSQSKKGITDEGIEEIKSESTQGTKFEPVRATGSVQTQVDKELSWTQHPAFLNALVGRIFFDFLPSNYGNATVKEMIQKKLSSIKLPDYLEELLVHDLDLGNSFPIISRYRNDISKINKETIQLTLSISRVSDPTINDRGLWIDLDIIYGGTISLTLDVKTNWMKTTQAISDEATGDKEEQRKASEAEPLAPGNLENLRRGKTLCIFFLQ